MFGLSGGGGGGGGGAFPYRSAHQQAGGFRGGRGGASKNRQRRHRQPRQPCAVEITIDPAHRPLLIGRGGNVVKGVQEKTDTKVAVFNKENKSVGCARISGPSMGSVLYGCLEIRDILPNESGPWPCRVVAGSNTEHNGDLHVVAMNDYLIFSEHCKPGVCAYAVTSTHDVSADDIEVEVDDLRFVNPNWTAEVEFIDGVVYVYGHASQHPESVAKHFTERLSKSNATSVAPNLGCTLCPSEVSYPDM